MTANEKQTTSSEFHLTDPHDLVLNPFTSIGKDWMLVTATDEEGNANPMTASWGGMGVLWNRPVCFIFIRPQRYTHDFALAGDRMTLSFFSEEYRDTLRVCGTRSGRDGDKAALCHLTPLRDGAGAVYYAEAKTVLSVRTVYRGSLEKCGFLDPSFLSHYPTEDFHTVFVAEVTEVRQK